MTEIRFPTSCIMALLNRSLAQALKLIHGE